MSRANKRHGLLTIGLLLLVVLAGCTGGGGGGQGGSAPPPRAGGPGGSNGGAAAAPPGDAATGAGGSFYLGDRRVVVREASMGVEVQRFDPAFDRARETVRAHGGFVADWELSVDRGWHRATLQIRVPSGNFSDVRDGLAGLGTVRRERVDAKDFTEKHDDLESTLSSLRDREAILLARIEDAESQSAERRLREDLEGVRSRIRSAEEQRTDLERRASLSSIELTLREPESARTPLTYESATGFQHTFLGAFYAGLAIVKYVVAAVGFLLPVGLTLLALAAVGLATARLTRRFWSDLDARLRALGLDALGGDGGG